MGVVYVLHVGPRLHTSKKVPTALPAGAICSRSNLQWCVANRSLVNRLALTDPSAGLPRAISFLTNLDFLEKINTYQFGVYI